MLRQNAVILAEDFSWQAITLSKKQRGHYFLSSDDWRKQLLGHRLVRDIEKGGVIKRKDVESIEGAPSVSATLPIGMVAVSLGPKELKKGWKELKAGDYIDIIWQSNLPDKSYMIMRDIPVLHIGSQGVVVQLSEKRAKHLQVKEYVGRLSLVIRAHRGGLSKHKGPEPYTPPDEVSRKAARGPRHSTNVVLIRGDKESEQTIYFTSPHGGDK